MKKGKIGKRYRAGMAAWFLLKQCRNILRLIEPYLYLLFLNHVLTEGNLEILPVLFAGYIGVFFLQRVAAAAEKAAELAVFPAMLCELREEVLKQYIFLDMERLSGNGGGEWKELLHDDTEKAAAYFRQTIELICFLTSLAATAALLLYLNWILALISFLFLPLSFAFTRFMKGRGNREYEKQRQLQGKYNDFMYKNLHMWKEIRTGCLEEMEEEQFSKQWEGLGRAFLKSHICWFINRTFLAFKDVFATRMGLYLFGGLLAINGTANVAILLSFMEYYADFADQILGAADIWVKREEQKVSLDRVRRILEMEAETDRTEDPGRFRSLQARNLEFSYAEGIPVLRNVSLQVERGEHLAVTGESGCGKSTLLRLLTGLQRPESGQILWNGIPMEKISRGKLYERMGVIFQDSELFNLSVRENLQLGRADAAEEELWEACRMANIEELIDGLPMKMDTLIGEKGIRLSGGQKQRLLLARMFLKAPEVLFLDESTSALDNENEREVMRHILEKWGNCTLIVVTHRRTSLQYFDRIVRLR